MFGSSRATRVRTAEWKSQNYATVFIGKNIKDKGRLSAIDSVSLFEPLWKGALKKPSIKIDGLPFIWEDNGIIYRSSSLAFEKNMWIASSAHNHWNAAIGNNIDKSTALIRHIRPALEGLNHLIDDNGLTQDLSRPADEDLLPLTIQKKGLRYFEKPSKRWPIHTLPIRLVLFWMKMMSVACPFILEENTKLPR